MDLTRYALRVNPTRRLPTALYSTHAFTGCVAIAIVSVRNRKTAQGEMSFIYNVSFSSRLACSAMTLYWRSVIIPASNFCLASASMV